MDYDFIICGAGSAGSVVAARLAECPDAKVLLLEAGGTDNIHEVLDPALWAHNLDSERDWSFTAEVNPCLNGRAIPMNMGKVLGGGSSINVMLWARGHKNDWEDFAAEADDPDWGYDAVLKIYRRIEHWQGKPDATRRGHGGPVFVQSALSPQPVANALLDAARELGLPVFDNPNGTMMEGRGGAAINDLIIKNGKRNSIFRAYVYPLLGASNLTVMSNTLVTRLILRGNRVVGLEAICNGQRQNFYAGKEVILSMGAVHTPKVLMQTGIGPGVELQAHGIRVVQHLPGVGQNHQDHVAFGCIFEYLTPQAVGAGGSEATLYWSSSETARLPDMFHCQLEFPVPSAETAGSHVPEHGWTMFAGLAHPKSRGCLRLTGPDALDPIRIDANTLSHPDDMANALANIELCRAIGNHRAFRHLVKREVLPGPLDPAQMQNFARNAAVTYWHQSCTAKMGRDAMSVVDNNLAVYGIGGLRIADASIMPHITSGNTMAPCVVIGERAAEIIRTKHGLWSEGGPF